MPSILGVKYRLKNFLTPAQVIGYPKSGNTWLRVMVTKAIIEAFGLNDQSIYYSDFHIFLSPRIPNILWSHGTKNRRSVVGSGNVDPFIRKNRRTIFLVRDPRDVLVSFYFHETFRNGAGKYASAEWQRIFPNNSEAYSISDYIRSDIRGIEYVVHFMNYWYSRRGDFRDFLMVRYEDMLARPEEEARSILSFLKLPTSEKIIAFATKESQFESMRKMEVGGNFPDADLGLPKNLEDVRTYKTRAGKSGGYSEYIKDIDLEYVNSVMREKLDPFFGYENP